MIGLLFVLLSMADASPNPREIARRAVINYEKDQVIALRYEHLESDEVKGNGVIVSKVVTIAGTPYGRQISKNGQPLGEAANKHEEQKFAKTLQLRRNELKGQRDNRIRKWKEETRFLEEAPDAFTFRMLPDDEIGGRAVYVLECTPQSDFEPREDRSKIFSKIQAKAWVDKEFLRIVKLEAETMEPVSIGWVLSKIGRGTAMEMEQMRLSDGSWVLKKLAIEGRTKVLVVDKRQLDQTVSYSDYRAAPDLKPLK